MFMGNIDGDPSISDLKRRVSRLESKVRELKSEVLDDESF